MVAPLDKYFMLEDVYLKKNHIFRHLKLKIAFSIHASNDENHNRN